MSVWKLEDFLAELDNMAELHKKRPNSVLAQGLWSSVCTKLTSVPHWRAQEVMRLMDKVDEIELPEGLKTNMQGTLDSLVSTNLGHMKIVAGTQTLEALSPYLSKTDWSSLAECTVTSDAMLVLATRLRKLGVVQLKEGTKKQVMALLVWWHKDQHSRTMAALPYVPRICEALYQLTSCLSCTEPVGVPRQSHVVAFRLAWSGLWR